MPSPQDVVLEIGQLICLNGFTTDPSEPGAERLVVTKTRPDAGLNPEFDIYSSDIDKENTQLLDPNQIFCVKGWTRSYCFHTVMLLARQHAELLEVGGGYCLVIK